MHRPRAILWENFHISYDVLLRKAELVEEDETDKLTSLMHIDTEILDDDDIDVVKINSGVFTPIGVFNILDPFNPIRHYEFRIGNTNFGITHEVQDILEETPGVEILRVLSRYKFVVGIGKMFSFGDVRRAIESQLCETSSSDFMEEIKDEQVKKQLKQEIENCKDNEDWLIHVLPNGKITVAKDTDENFNSMCEILIRS
jgi:hypothetical protein